MSTVSQFRSLALAGLLAVTVGCHSRVAVTQAPQQPQLKPAPATPIAEKKDELGKPSWNPQWDAVVEKALPAEMLSDDEAHAVKPFCPRYRAMSEVDRRAFWAYVFQALAGAEAGLVPTTDVRHTEPEVAVKDTVTRRMVRSEGLLQLTYMDADRYGCNFDWERDKQLPEKDPDKSILQPENNLVCGIRIMQNQLIEKHQPLVSSSSYWSTLQPGTISYKVFAKQMKNVPDVCRVNPSARRRRGKGGAGRSVAGSEAAGGRAGSGGSSTSVTSTPSASNK